MGEISASINRAHDQEMANRQLQREEFSRVSERFALGDVSAAAHPENTSGIIPLDLRVLVKPDSAEKVSAGGIIIPEAVADQKRQAMMKGTLVAVGENAWEEASSRSAAFAKPAPGHRVLIAKYGGVVVTGLDGEDYRLLNDEDILGKLDENA